MKFRCMLITCFVVVMCGRGYAQQGEVVALTEAGITEAFNGVDMLREMGISAIQEVNADNAQGVIVNDYSFEAPGVNVTIRKGAVTFNRVAPEEASLVLARREANLQMSLDLPVYINGREFHATMSKWKWYGAAKYEGGTTGQQDSKSYIVIRLTGEIRVADFGDLVAEFGGGDIPLLNMVEETAMRNPEIILPIGLEPPILFSVFDAVIGGESKEIDIYGFSMSPEVLPQEKIKSLTLMIDYHSIPIKLQELAVMVENQAGAAGFSAPFDAFDPGNARVKDAAVVMAMKTMDIEIRDLDPVMQVPFFRIYGEGKQLPLHFLRGVNMVATFTPADFPAFYEYFEKLNIARDLLLTVQGTVGYERAAEKKEEAPDPEGKDEEKEKNSAQIVGEYLKLGLYVGLSTYDIPQYLAEKGYRLVEGAGVEFFVEHAPAAFQFGVASHFDVNLGGRINADGSANQDDISPVRLAGSLQASITSSDVGMAIAGKMIGVWRTPGGVPFAIADPVVKVKITATNTYFAGAKGSYYIGHEGEEKKVLVGGNLGIQYTGYEAHPKAGAFKGGINSLAVQDLVNVANIMNAIDKGTWRPWDVPEGPLLMGDLYNAELQNVFFQIVSPDGGDVDLKFGTEGIAGSGTLLYQNEILGDVLFEATWTAATIPLGLRLYGHLADFSFGRAVFDGADVEMALAPNDLPPRFILKTGFALGEERLGVDIWLNVPKPHAKVTLPNSVKELAKTSPQDIVNALENLQNMDIEDVVITNPEILAGETLQWGAFVLNNAAMWAVNEAGQLKLKVRGEKNVYGVVVGVEGEWVGESHEFILRADAKGNYPLRDLNFAYVESELHYDGNNAWARATGHASKAGVGADMVLEIPNPEEGHGAGDASIKMKEYVVQGTAELHHDSEKTELKLTVNPGTSMAHYDLSGLDLSGMSFDGVDLSDCNLMDADFSGASFKGIDILAANLNNSNFTGADFTGANLRGSALTGATLTDAIIKDVEIYASGLSMDQIQAANQVGAIFTDARWQDADLSGKDFSGIIFKNSIMHRANLSNVNFSGAIFNGAEFQYANLSGANLEGATLAGAQCEQVNFTGANLKGANFEKTYVRDAIMADAVIDASTNFTDANMTAAIDVDKIKGLELTTTIPHLDRLLPPVLDDVFEPLVTYPIKSLEAARDLANRTGLSDLNKTVNASAPWQMGGFDLNNVSMTFAGSTGNVSLTVSGAVNVAGNEVQVSGQANVASGEVELNGDAGSLKFGDYGFAHGGLTLQWNEQEQSAVIRSRGRIGNGATAEIDLEVRGPDDASGSGDVEISMKAYKVNGKAIFSHSPGETRLELIVNPGAALNHYDLSGLDLSGMVFDGANLSDCNLTNINFTGASFRDAIINATNLDNSDYTGADFSGANLARSAFTGATLNGANFTGANLSGANLTKAVGSYTVLNNANLEGATLTEANFQDVRLNGANMKQVKMKYINLKHAQLEKADLSHADLQGANLQSVKASGLIMHQARADGIAGQDGEYFNAQITYCDMSDAIWDRSNFTDAKVQDIKFTRSSLDNSDFTRALLNTSIFNDCRLIETRFYGANLGGTEIRNADWQGAVLDGDTMFNNAKLSGNKNMDKVKGLSSARWTGVTKDFDPSNPGGGGGSVPKPKTPW